nr:MAG TPA: hypothetical protein [Caudoviricetes sp.]
MLIWLRFPLTARHTHGFQFAIRCKFRFRHPISG